MNNCHNSSLILQSVTHVLIFLHFRIPLISNVLISFYSYCFMIPKVAFNQLGSKNDPCTHDKLKPVR